jgi:hydroxymethylpyrimidine/phosphomethylpyrimidine kinase
VPTALTVQDNDRVFAVHALDPDLVRYQAQVLIDVSPSRRQLGIAGVHANAERSPADPPIARTQSALAGGAGSVLASGQGDQLSRDDAARVIWRCCAWPPSSRPTSTKRGACAAMSEPARQAALLMGVAVRTCCSRAAMAAGAGCDQPLVRPIVAFRVCRGGHRERALALDPPAR